ncbi:MAG: cysteine hydrolase [Endomicrobiales bacterium]|nr:cysteine hydrolase [Endomicrobiales bacterium]
MKIAAVAAVLLLAAAGYVCGKFWWMSGVTKGEQIPAYSPGRSALVVIDIQEGITGSLSKNEGFRGQSEEFIGAVNRVAAEAKAMRLPVIYVKHVNTDPVFNFLSGGLLARGSPQAEIDGRVIILSKNVFAKQKMDSFSNREFGAFLKKNKVEKLYITGLDAAYCVDRTVKGALNRGYAVTVIEDAVISDTEHKKRRKLREYAALGAGIDSSATWKKAEIRKKGEGK